jgi:hypothetical protein
VITNNLAFVSVATTAGGPATTTCGVDLTTHQQVWSTSAVGAMSIGDGILYIGGPTGLLTALNLAALQLVEPTSYQLNRGVLISGTLASILSVDDASLKIGPGPTLNAQEAPAQVVVIGVSPSPAPTQLRFHLQASVGTPNLSQTIEMWNYTTSQWVSAGTVAATRTESVQEVSIANPAQYVQTGTGQVQARLSWKQVGPTLLFLWPVSIDQAVWLEG